MEDFDYQSKDGISIGSTVTTREGRVGRVTDLYFKGKDTSDDCYFAAIEINSSEGLIIHSLVRELRPGAEDDFGAGY